MRLYTLFHTKYLISDWIIKWQLCLVSSPEQLRLLLHLTGQHTDRCWTDWKSLLSCHHLCESCCAHQMARPVRTHGPRDFASVPSVALYRHSSAGSPGSTEGLAPPACSRERKITGKLRVIVECLLCLANTGPLQTKILVALIWIWRIHNCWLKNSPYLSFMVISMYVNYNFTGWQL